MVQLENKEVTYSYFADPVVRVHGQRVQPVRSREGQHGRRAQLPRRRPARASSRSTRAARSRSRFRTRVVREIIYTEPAVRGDTSGKVHEARQARRPASRSRCRCSATPATRSRSTRAPASTAAASRPEGRRSTATKFSPPVTVAVPRRNRRAGSRGRRSAPAGRRQSEARSTWPGRARTLAYAGRSTPAAHSSTAVGCRGGHAATRCRTSTRESADAALPAPANSMPARTAIFQVCAHHTSSCCPTDSYCAGQQSAPRGRGQG